MSKKLRYGKGVGSIEITGDLKDLIDEALKTANPILMTVLEKEVERLKDEAQADWPTRQSRYGESEGSKDSWETGIRIVPPNKVEAFVRNTAQYAWAIKAGKDGKSKTKVKPGKRVANVLLWNPAKKGAAKIIQKIANEQIKQMKLKKL